MNLGLTNPYSLLSYKHSLASYLRKCKNMYSAGLNAITNMETARFVWIVSIITFIGKYHCISLCLDHRYNTRNLMLRANLTPYI